MSDESVKTVSRIDYLRMATDIVAAYVGNNKVDRSDIPALINGVFDSLHNLEGGTVEHQRTVPKPAISVRKSVTPDYIVCLEDGKKLKMLKRHLRTSYNMTPEEYRARWNLPSDYPMVAPNYAKRRSDFAKKIGLGRKTV